MKLTDKAEDILEALWFADEEGRDIVSYEDIQTDPNDGVVQSLLNEGLIEIKPEGLCFTIQGKIEGRQVIRRHRLAELLMRDVLDIWDDSQEEWVCRFEHLLKEGVDTKICTLLNHPTTCPHGKPIPPGSCCEHAKDSGVYNVLPLTELKSEDSGRIAYIKTKEPEKMNKLMAMGVLPGNDIMLMQRFPAYIFRIGYSEFAIDASMAEEIYVRRIKRMGVRS